jgi:hypothetical protein
MRVHRTQPPCLLLDCTSTSHLLCHLPLSVPLGARLISTDFAIAFLLQCVWEAMTRLTRTLTRVCVHTCVRRMATPPAEEDEESPLPHFDLEQLTHFTRAESFDSSSE